MNSTRTDRQVTSRERNVLPSRSFIPCFGRAEKSRSARWRRNTVAPTADQNVVYLLWRDDDVGDDTPEAKLLGVYSSEAQANDRIQRSLALPGFADHPADFLVAYEADHDEWTEGYVLA